VIVGPVGLVAGAAIGAGAGTVTAEQKHENNPPDEVDEDKALRRCSGDNC
jgi:hypothetical protein